MSDFAEKIGRLHLDGYRWIDTIKESNPHFVCKKGEVARFVMDRPSDGSRVELRYCFKCDSVLGVTTQTEAS